MLSALLATATGLYRQPCACASRLRLAKRRARHLREEAVAARHDADLSASDGELLDAIDFRLLADERETAARRVVREARSSHSPCLVCGNTGEVIGNGTYGGPAKHPRVLVSVL